MHQMNLNLLPNYVNIKHENQAQQLGGEQKAGATPRRRAYG
jgi:hypothetical protein